MRPGTMGTVKRIVEKNPKAHGLSRASCIAVALMRHYSSKGYGFDVETWEDLASVPKDAQDVELSPEQRELLYRARYRLPLLRLHPETTLAVCTSCNAFYLRVPGSSTVPRHCTFTPLCHGDVSWAGRASIEG